MVGRVGDMVLRVIGDVIGVVVIDIFIVMVEIVVIGEVGEVNFGVLVMVGVMGGVIR